MISREMEQSRQEENKYSPAANVTSSSHLEVVLHDTCRFTPVVTVTTVTGVEEDLLADGNTRST